MPTQKSLLFSDVDGLAFAAECGKLDQSKLPSVYIPRKLGPLVELLHLHADGLIPNWQDWLVLDTAMPMVEALEQAQESWVSSNKQHAGFIRSARLGPDGDNRLTGFLMSAKRAAKEISKLPATVAGQLVAAMQELENNIHEHADAPKTGLLAYRAELGAFEFVVADRGIGILRSLSRCPTFTEIPDEGKALEAALTDGVSRFGTDSNRGHGFRPIFIGLANIYGELRFRSGDHALTMDGTNPTLTSARIAQKPLIDGFLASVRCHSKPVAN